MKLTAQQRYVLGRANRQLSLTGDLYLKKGSQSVTAGRWRVIAALERLGLVDGKGQITDLGRAALSSDGAR